MRTCPTGETCQTNVCQTPCFRLRMRRDGYEIVNGVVTETAWHDVQRLLNAAKARYEAMTAAEREELHRAQREDWVKAEMQWAEDFRNGLCERD